MPIALRSYLDFIRFLISNNNNLIMTYAPAVNFVCRILDFIRYKMAP